MAKRAEGAVEVSKIEIALCGLIGCFEYMALTLRMIINLGTGLLAVSKHNLLFEENICSDLPQSDN